MRERTFQPVNKRAVRRRGFTLIEVMVALAIFVFGAMAILRIFPSGLGVVRDTEIRAMAARMSAGTINNLESKATRLEGVYKTSASGNWMEPISSVGAPLTYTGGRNSGSLPQGPQDDIFATTLGDLRYIRGETQTVKTSSTGLYVLTRYPYTGDVGVFIEGKVNGVKINSSGALDFSQATLADGSPFNDGPTFPTRPHAGFRHSMAFPGSLGDTTYYVSYLWEEAAATPPANPRVQGVSEENLRMPSNALWTVGDGQTLHTANVMAGQVNVRFRKLVGVVTPSAAPAPLPATTHDGYVGLVRLPGSLSDGDTVLLDYSVADWRALVHDEVPSSPTTPPTANQWEVSFPMSGIDTELGMTTLFIKPGGPPQFDWAALDAAGAFTQSGTSRIVDITSNAGRITCETPNNTLTRTVYRSLDNWAHQLGVAATSYEPFIAGGRPPRSVREGWREYVWLPGTGANSGKLYFQPSEAGKTVMVTYEYMDGTTPRLISNAIVPIGEELENISGATLTAFVPLTGKVAVAQLGDVFGNALTTNLSAVRSVNGVSTMARTAWVKGQRYSQVIGKGMRPLSQ